MSEHSSNNHSYWTQNIARNLVRRYHAQGGSERTYFTPAMNDDLEFLLESMGDEIWAVHTKAFETLSRKRS